MWPSHCSDRIPPVVTVLIPRALRGGLPQERRSETWICALWFLGAVGAMTSGQGATWACKYTRIDIMRMLLNGVNFWISGPFSVLTQSLKATLIVFLIRSQGWCCQRSPHKLRAALIDVGNNSWTSAFSWSLPLFTPSLSTMQADIHLCHPCSLCWEGLTAVHHTASP